MRTVSRSSGSPPARTLRPRLLALALAIVASLAVAACGDSDDPAADAIDTAAATVPSATGPAVTDAVPDDAAPGASASDASAVSDPAVTEPAAADPTSSGEATAADSGDLGRVVVLSEEFLLADVLALGIEPIASTASVAEAGFQGIPDDDTAGIEVLPMTTLSLEYLASLQPDTIIVLQFWVDQVGEDVLAGMGDLMIVPDGLGNREQIETLGAMLGRESEAAALVEELDLATADARVAVGDDCVLSLAAIYPGPSVAAFVAGPWEIPSSILSTGCVLDPGPDVAAPDTNGRAWLSPEQLGLLDAELLVLLQSDTVEGESDAVDEIGANPVWAQLPAVQGDNVVIFDRLGYPGIEGQIRFLDEFGALFAS